MKICTSLIFVFCLLTAFRLVASQEPSALPSEPAVDEPAAELKTPDEPSAADMRSLEETAATAKSRPEPSDSGEPAEATTLIDKVATEEPVADKPIAIAGDVVLTKRFRKAMLIDVQGSIFGAMQSYMFNRLDVAQRGGFDLIILRITSPGGGLDESLAIARRLSEIEWATTIAFVPEEAYSGAAILSLGCDRIYMQPRALIGDTGPIYFHGGLFEHAEEKVVSALASSLHQLAAGKNRPGAVAEAMVDRKLVVHEATNKKSGARTFLTTKDIEVVANQEAYDIGAAIPESGQNRFLTVAGSRAVELMIAEGTFESERAMLEQLKIDQLRTTRRTWVDQTVFVLNRPVVSGLLLVIGLIGLYVEFAVPGISIAALISLTCFALFFWSHALGGTSGWLEVMLFALGVGCLGVEIFILPGVGLFGLSGVVMILMALVMASQDFVLPQSTVQWTTLRNNLLIVLGAMGCLAVALGIHIAYFDSIPGLGRLRLETPDVDPSAVSNGAASLASAPFSGYASPVVGQQGIADSVLRPAGKVRFANEMVDVVTEGDFLDPGTHVEVVKREGNRVIVRRVS